MSMVKSFAEEFSHIKEANIFNMASLARMGNTASRVGRGALSQGWNEMGWRAGQTGISRYLPGGKALTVGFTGLALPGALSSEDPMGEGRSRAERLGGLAGNTVGGLAGGTLGTSLAKKFTSAVGPRAGIAGKVLGALPTIGGVLGGFAGMSGGEALGGLPFRPFRSTPQPQQPVQPMPQQMPGV